MALYILTLGIYYDYVYIWNHILYNLKKSNGFSNKIYIYIYIYIYNGRFKCITIFFYFFFHLFSSSFVLLRFVNIYKRFIQNKTCIKARYTFYFIFIFLYWVRHMISHVFSLFLWSQKCCRHLFGMATISKNFKCW